MKFTKVESDAERHGREAVSISSFTFSLFVSFVFFVVKSGA